MGEAGLGDRRRADQAQFAHRADHQRYSGPDVMSFAARLGQTAGGFNAASAAVASAG